jgi:hypothetical protein
VWPSFIRFCRKAREGPRPAVLGAASAVNRRASQEQRKGGPLAITYEEKHRLVGPRNTDGVGQGLVPPGQEGGGGHKRAGYFFKSQVVRMVVCARKSPTIHHQMHYMEVLT